MRHSRRWWFIAPEIVLLVIGGLVVRASLQPCAWLDRTLGQSGCLGTLVEQQSAITRVGFSLTTAYWRLVHGTVK